jgi:hypothetical protein
MNIAHRIDSESSQAGEAITAFDVFGSDLPDEAFDGAFDQRRQHDWREVDL